MTKVIDFRDKSPREATDEVLLAVGMCPICKREVEWFHHNRYIGGTGYVPHKVCQECYYEVREDV